MAHFAKLNENNIVLSVEVVNNDVITVNGKEVEQVGIDFLTNLYGYPYWKQTSFNLSFRKNWAAEGYLYDPIRDAFIPPVCHNGATINEETCLWNCSHLDHETIEVTNE